ncbi:MAG: hypothetical protein A2Z04_00475 [Chloroflexi bacterium RBG_16_57_9]|nr:MAG: hypothetical protein A2Z04_00475 [Chloroflexi bacterium RBG_16_57_9]
MRAMFAFLRGLVFGSVVGATTGLLLTPRSGEETRELIQDRIDDAISAGKQAAEEKRRELETQLGVPQESVHQA